MIYALLAAAFYLLGMVSCARAMDIPLYEKLEVSYHERYTEGSGRIRRISEKEGRLTLYLENVEFTSPERLAPGQMVCLVVEAGSTFREEDSDSTDSAASAGSTGIAASAAAGEGSGSAGSAGSAAAAADAYIDPVTGMD
ncbi:MAG: hypothetical protein II627_01740, partial [Lachnospiraceae bacterium]|nr:hypothetical protein [Lachnospiraceae bacterium]